VIEYAEEHDWDVGFYLACFYIISRIERESALVGGEFVEEPFYAGDPARMCQTIRATPKQCLAFKILGAGRRCTDQDEAAAAFKFAFDNIKSIDAVVVGMYPDQVQFNVGHTLAALGLV
jgi:hypothetical protein